MTSLELDDLFATFDHRRALQLLSHGVRIRGRGSFVRHGFVMCRTRW